MVWFLFSQRARAVRRYWLQDSVWNGDSVELTGEDFHHIIGVCRMQVGDRFEILENGQALLVEVQKVSRKEARARKLESRSIERAEGPDIELALSVPKFAVFESVLEKMVELGVVRVQPILSDFSFVRSNLEGFEKKQDRFAKIIRGATSQTGRGDLMELSAPVPLEDYLKKQFSTNHDQSHLGLFAYEGGRTGIGVNTRPLHAALAQLHESDRLRSARLVTLFVGSEGGFSDDEVRLFQRHELIPTIFGSQVLRVETACVALVSILKYELRGDYGQRFRLQATE